MLLTFGLIYIFEELRSILWGDDVHGVKIPELLGASIQLTENLSYPVYRLFISGCCIALAVGLYLLISKTRLGMKIRAGAFNREMAEALGRPVDPGLTRRNITLDRGPIPTRPGERMSIGGVELEVVRIAAPCRLLDDWLGPGAMKALRSPRGGTVFRLLSSGTITVGDEAEVSPAPG